MPKISASIRTVQSKLSKVAALSGDNKKIATQEVKKALAQGLITKAERDLIARAISDNANTNVADMKARMNRYVEAFEKSDTNKDGEVSKAERNAAQKAASDYGSVQGSSVPKAKQEALRKKVITTTKIDAAGNKKQVMEFSIGSLLDKLIALKK